MNGLIVLLLLCMGFGGGWWVAQAFYAQDTRTLHEHYRRMDKWADR